MDTQLTGMPLGNLHITVASVKDRITPCSHRRVKWEGFDKTFCWGPNIHKCPARRSFFCKHPDVVKMALEARDTGSLVVLEGMILVPVILDGTMISCATCTLCTDEQPQGA